MTNSFRKKLKSSAGASITFALLLFLVCAVVGSVVLAAGTAASGRFSKLAEMDRRRASVNSAAELIAGMIDGKSVVSTTVTKESFTETVVYDVGSVTRSSTDPVVTEGPDTTVTGDGFFLLRDVASGVGTASSLTLDITHSADPGSTVDAAALKVKAAVSVDASGNIAMTVTNDDGGEKYSVRLKFEAKVTTESASSSSEGAPRISGNPDVKPYIVSTDKSTVVTETTTVVWKLVGSERVGSDS